ncbi:ankyrin repeat-containing domain protein [Morchella snyderi]|nr:ankyrin repeat-containing domain protein [Morchella snyderi]
MTPSSSQFEELKLITVIERGHYTHTITDELSIRYETWTRTGTLGAGGFGTVYKETCQQRSGVRAVKQIWKNHVRWNEIAILAQLRAYPEHFVQLIGWFEDENDIYLAMEYLPGDLGSLLKDRNISEDDTKRVTRQILVGLDIMHKKDICHRDLKPSNILVVQFIPLAIKIADFGLSKHFDGTECRSELGTNHFKAPEMWGIWNEETSVYTAAVDIWSLGCLVYLMVTKTLPFPQPKDLRLFVERRTPFPRSTAPPIPPSALGLITSMLQPLSENRPSAAKAQLHSWLLIKEPAYNTIWTSEAPTQSTSESGLTQIVRTSSRDTVPASGKPKSTHPETSGPSQQSRLSDLEVRELLAPRPKTLGPDKQPRASALLRTRVNVPESIQYLLVAAAASGNCELLIEQLGKGARPMYDPSGYTPIYRAAENGHLPIIKLLLRHGAHLGVEGKCQVSALHGATTGGNLQVVEYLLERGADLSAKSMEGYTAIHIAAKSGSIDVLKLLVDRGADMSERSGGTQGWTALLLAAWKGHLDTVQFLLERGADISAKKLNNGCNALQLAAEFNHIEVVGLLLERGAALSAKSTDGYTALHSAALCGSIDVLKLLVDRGADISERGGGTQGWTALLMAAWKGHLDTVQYLVERGADISAKMLLNGWNALQLAASEGHSDMARLLLEIGASTTSITDDGDTAISLAASAGHTDVVRLLIEWSEKDMTIPPTWLDNPNPSEHAMQETTPAREDESTSSWDSMMRSLES